MINTEAQSKCSRSPAEGALDSENEGSPLEEAASELTQSKFPFSGAANQCSWSPEVAPSTWSHSVSCNNDRFPLLSISAGRRQQGELGRKAGQPALRIPPSSSELHFATHCGCWDCGQTRVTLGQQRCRSLEASNTEGSSRGFWKEPMHRGHSPKTTGRRSPRHPGLSWQKPCRWEIASRSPGEGEADGVS